MSGFTKLVPEIVQSSLWNEPAEIRCVWIAMIATKDESGYVRGDARTIARVANVSIKSAQTALVMFQEPDPSSHTPDNEGRRIMPAPGGWIVLNHSIYRARDDVYREKNRQRVRKFRSKMEGGDHKADVADNNVTLQETLQKRCHSASASASESVSDKEGSQEGGFTLADCIKAAGPIGMTSDQVSKFFHHYNAIGWVYPGNRKISNLSSALAKWKADGPSFGKGKYNQPDDDEIRRKEKARDEADRKLREECLK